MLNRDSPFPLYYQIKELLLDQIRRGELNPGDLVPSVKELCSRLGVSHITVNKAMLELTNQGVLHRQQGKGTFVADFRRVEKQLFHLTTFANSVRQSNMIPSTRLIYQTVCPASESTAQVLQIAPGDEIVELARLRLANGEPVLIETARISHALCPGILKYDLASRSLYDVWANEYGLTLAKGRRTIEAVLLREDEARLLGVPAGQPAFLSILVTYLDTGRPIEHTKQIFRGDRYRFIAELDGLQLK